MNFPKPCGTEITTPGVAVNRGPGRPDLIFRRKGGGFTRLNRLFNGQLQEVLESFNEEPWRSPGLEPQHSPPHESSVYRDWIADRNENLDIAWLRDDSETGAEDLPEPATLAQEAIVELEAAIDLPVTLARTLNCREFWQNWEKRWWNCRLRDYLRELTGLKVDVVTKNGLQPRIRDRILPEVVYL